MIVVCEPQCKGISHEKVNSGFIYGLRLAYPKDRIMFFSDNSHFRKIEHIFKSNNVKVGNLKHFSINFDADKSFSLGGIIRYYFLFRSIFDKLLSFGENRIFFLSTNPIILYSIKKLKQQDKYKDINFSFVLHGELEDIANRKYKEPYVPVIKKRQVVAIFRHPETVLPLFKSLISQLLVRLYSRYSLIFKRRFRTKRMMMWQHSSQYKYISLSPHVTENAKKYLDTDYLNFNTIYMPIIFTRPYSISKNKYIKFAVFGYGDSAQMYKMLTSLSKKKISKSYEIKIISMDNNGTEGFPNIRLVSRGKVLTRKEMEDAAQDVDVFINLYIKTQHRLGCSLSIFEALSYLKPVLHLDNPGYNYFNKSKIPIGYRCESLKDFVDKMCDMIENYPRYRKDLTTFRKNMLEYRKEYAIENNLDNLRKSYTF